jgi:hypothetical protein
VADTGAPYFIPFAEPTNLVRDWPDLSEDVALAIVAALENIPVTEKRIAAFTGSGTWTVPAGVTYAIAHMLGGGGGSGETNTGGNGGDSTVAFAGGTVTAKGLSKVIMVGNMDASQAGAANTGQNAQAQGRVQVSGGRSDYTYGGAPTNVFVVAAAAVTPAASISVTVGAGGSAGTGGAAGGSGYVYIEYYEEV